MLICALDLATVTGVAIGRSDMNHPSQLKHFSVRMRKSTEDHEMAAYNIDCWVRQVLIPFYGEPDIIVAEAMMSLDAQPSEDSARVAMAVHTGLWMACRRWSIRMEKVANSTMCKHFIGRGAKPKGAEKGWLKKEVRRQAIRLGYADERVRDLNRTDAIGVFDFAANTYARRSPAGVALLGGVA